MKKLVSLFVALILMFSFTFAVSAADFPAVEVSLASNYNAVEIGEEVKVTLSFDNASEYPYGLAAFCSYLTYDSNVLRVKSTNAAVPRSSIRHNSMSGELRSVYTFSSAQKKPGFNTDGPFYTVTFEAIGAGRTDISVTFDTITVTDYETEQLNFKVGFNSPSITVNVEGGADEPVSSKASSTQSVVSNTTSSKSPSNAVSSAQSTYSNTASNTTAGTVSNLTPTDRPTNDGFQDVADSGQDTVQDVFDEEGEIIEQTESKAPVNNNTVGDKEQTNQNEVLIDDDGKDDTPWTVWIAVAVGVVALVAVVVVIILKTKKK